MNPSILTSLDALFDGCPHGGGWARVGWQMPGADDDTLNCFDGYWG